MPVLPPLHIYLLTINPTILGTLPKGFLCKQSQDICHPNTQPPYIQSSVPLFILKTQPMDLPFLLKLRTYTVRLITVMSETKSTQSFSSFCRILSYLLGNWQNKDKDIGILPLQQKNEHILCQGVVFTLYLFRVCLLLKRK